MKNKSGYIVGAIAFTALALYLRPSPIPPSPSPAPSPSESAVAVEPLPPSPMPQVQVSTSIHQIEKSQAPERKNLDQLLIRVRSALPKVTVMRGRTSEEVHNTPPEVLEAGRRLGELAEFLEKNPNLIREALPTYVACANDAGVMPAIRGLCTFRLQAYESDWDGETRTAFGKIPAEIRTLANQLN